MPLHLFPQPTDYVVASSKEALFFSYYAHFWRLSLLPALGFLFTYFAYYPGLLSADTSVQLYEAQNFYFADWHPTIATWLWSITDTFLAGPKGYFLLQLILYWGGFFLIRLHFAQKPAERVSLIGKFTAALPFLPFFINLCGTLWKDVLVLGCLLTAFGLILLKIRHSFRSPLLTGTIFALLILGGLSRHNSLFAVAPLVFLYFWPHVKNLQKPLLTFLKRLFLVTICSSCALIAINFVFESAITHTKKMGPGQAIFLFDLVGISTRIGVNLLPGPWREDQTEAILKKCYEPHLVDTFLWGKCTFVGEALHQQSEPEPPDSTLPPRHIFPLFPDWCKDRANWSKDRPLFPAWIQAVTQHPVAYLQHRWAHFQTLLVPAYFFISPDVGSYHYGFRLNGVFKTMERTVAFFGALPGIRLIFSVAFWYLVSLLIFALSLWKFWKKSANTLAGQYAYYALIASASATFYAFPLFFVSIADNYRYALWTAAATCVACLFLWAARRAELNGRPPETLTS